MLRAVSNHHDLNAGIYASVTRPGTITVGDVVTLH
jgi:MOSC domain-containing protein YiiM